MEDNKQVEKFDPSKLMDGVKDRIKATFVSLIPDNEWEDLVKKEVEAFFNPSERLFFLDKEKRTTASWHSQTFSTVEVEQSPFRAIVWDHCKVMTISILKEKINKEYFNSQFSIDGDDVDDKMGKYIKEYAPIAIAQFFEGILQSQKYNLQNQIQQIKNSLSY